MLSSPASRDSSSSMEFIQSAFAVESRMTYIVRAVVKVQRRRISLLNPGQVGNLPAVRFPPVFGAVRVAFESVG